MLSDKLADLKFEFNDEAKTATRIRVIGVGGGGSNAVARMLNVGMEGVEFYIMNTDVQALAASPVPNKLALGSRLTNGLGAGSNPEIGRESALEETERIVEVLEGADMVFVTAGLGGGTGTGAAPVVASIARQMNALTVAVVTKPFSFEGSRRMRMAEEGLELLAESVDTVITIPNDRLLALVPAGTSFLQAFGIANDVLLQAVQGISDIIVTPGLINRDFSDIRATMVGMGYAMMGTALASGEGGAAEAARQAISSPLLEANGITGAKGILINITGSHKLTLHDVSEACNLVREAAECDEAQINFGVVLNDAMEDNVKITVIATGFGRDLSQKGAYPYIPPPAPRVQAKRQAPRHVPEPQPPVEYAHEAPASVSGAPEPEYAPEPVAQAAMAAAAGAGGEQIYDHSAPAFAEESGPPPAVGESSRYPKLAKVMENVDAGRNEPVDPNDLEVPAFMRRTRVLQLD